jgi:hypothetical protein
VPCSRCEVAQQVEDLGLDGDVERGGGLVGDEQARVAGERHGDHDALAHAAGELVRVGVAARRPASGMPTMVEQLHRALARAPRAERSRRVDASVSPIWQPTV